MNAGMDISLSFQLISAACFIIMAPTTTSAGAAANVGICVKRPANRRPDSINTPTTTATNPVLPPSSTPAADSMYVVVVLVPAKAPTIVAPASDMKASSEFFNSSFSSTYPACLPTEYRVPAVSKMSTKRKAIITKIKSPILSPVKSPSAPKAANMDSSGNPATSNKPPVSRLSMEPTATASTPLYGSEAPIIQPPIMVVPNIP